MSNFYITIANGLLESKHVNSMGDAVWLYMWFVDKTTSINENGIGKVLGAKPLTHEEVATDLGIPVKTYRRWVGTLRDAGYINTVRTPHGLIVTLNKAKKSFKRSAKTEHQKKSDVPIRASDVPKPHMYIDNIPNGILQDNTTNVVLQIKAMNRQTYKNLVSKMYYDAIKTLDLPVLNHNNLRSKIVEMSNTSDRIEVLKYLEFMSKSFKSTEWNYKPHVDEALDIFGKQKSVINTFKKHLSEKPKVWRAKK